MLNIQILKSCIKILILVYKYKNVFKWVNQYIFILFYFVTYFLKIKLHKKMNGLSCESLNTFVLVYPLLYILDISINQIITFHPYLISSNRPSSPLTNVVHFSPSLRV